MSKLNCNHPEELHQIDDNDGDPVKFCGKCGEQL